MKTLVYQDPKPLETSTETGEKPGKNPGIVTII
jgi:hypothetical protein